MRMKRIRKNKLSKGTKLGIIILMIMFFVSLIIKNFNTKITPKILNIAKISINKLNEVILTQYRVSDMYEEINLNDVITIEKNKNDEIINVDFKLKVAYDALSTITSYLHTELENVSMRKNILKYYDEDLSMDLESIILSVPIGITSTGVYFSNLGPRIPVKIDYMGYMSSSLRIKLEEYGINSVLISLYIDCVITNEFIIPSLEENVTNNCSILISSKLIQGKVPEYYGNGYEVKSNIKNLQFE